jgi:hypothetical protein
MNAPDWGVRPMAQTARAPMNRKPARLVLWRWRFLAVSQGFHLPDGTHTKRQPKWRKPQFLLQQNAY